jgi:hypothetical protein
MKNQLAALMMLASCVSSSAFAAESKKQKAKAPAPSHAEPAQPVQSEPAQRQRKAPLADQWSGQGYGMAGCGLGSVIFGDKPGMVQVFASTTNGIYGNQTFGISSATSNCVTPARAQKSAALFITANREIIQKDIARGNGETLTSLSQILGCSNSEMVGSKLQQSYQNIVPTDQAPTDRVINTIMSTLKQDGELSKTCSLVIG